MRQDIKCRECGGKTKVVDTYNAKNGIRRRRVCRNCAHRMSTLEVFADDYENLLAHYDGVYERALKAIGKIVKTTTS